MSMKDWAEQEVKLACARETKFAKEDGDRAGADYGISCYESALKAFKSLYEDGHSGCSISITKNILNRLIDGKCLTPIEDVPEAWDNVTHFGTRRGIKEIYQCKRMGSLFKDIHTDGSVKFNDNDRIICVSSKNGSTWYSGLVSDIINKMFPIEMPYMPTSKPYRIYCDDFLTDPKNGDFDTYAIYYVISPDDKRIDINRYFKSSDTDSGWKDISKEDFGWKEISKEDFEQRVELDKKLKEKKEWMIKETLKSKGICY